MVERQFLYDGEVIVVPLLEAGATPDKAWVKAVALAIGSDGCTGVPDFHKDCCIVHDLGYKFQVDAWGNKVKRAEVDATFRKCHKPPMSWWRWLGVRIGGAGIWARHREKQGADPVDSLPRAAV